MTLNILNTFFNNYESSEWFTKSYFFCKFSIINATIEQKTYISIYIKIIHFYYIKEFYGFKIIYNIIKHFLIN